MENLDKLMAEKRKLGLKCLYAIYDGNQDELHTCLLQETSNFTCNKILFWKQREDEKTNLECKFEEEAFKILHELAKGFWTRIIDSEGTVYTSDAEGIIKVKRSANEN